MYQWPPYFAQKTHSAKWLAVCPPSRKNEKHKSMCSIGHFHQWYQAAIWQIMAKSLNASTWVLSEISGLWHTSGWKILSSECSPSLFNAHLRLWESKKRKVLHVAHHEGGHMLEIVAKRKLKVIVNLEPNKPFWTKFESGKVKSGFLHYWNSWCSSILYRELNFITL